MHRQRIFTIILAIAGAYACFLPWIGNPFLGWVTGVHAYSYSKLVLFGFVVTALIAVLGDRKRPIRTGLAAIAALVGALAGVAGVLQIVALMRGAAEATGPLAEAIRTGTGVGVGLYLLVVVGLALPVSQFVLRGSR